MCRLHLGLKHATTLRATRFWEQPKRHRRNTEMIMSCLIRSLMLAAMLAVFMTPSSTPAFAQAQQAQVDHERAWATCLAKIDRDRPRTDSNSHEAERVAAFKACMANLGVRP